jgi:uncharacterized membrane protein
MQTWEMIGHLSFALTAISWMLGTLLWIRVSMLFALALGVAFNYLVPNGPLWIPVGWLSLFIAINVIQIARIVVPQRKPVAIRRSRTG